MWRHVIPGTVILSFAALAADPAPIPGAKYFDEARRQSNDGPAAGAAASAEKGWSAARSAGLAHPGFPEAVYTAAAAFAGLGYDLRADSVFSEAESLCDTPALEPARLRLQYMHADHLIRSSLYVKSEALLRASLAMENRAPRKSPLYVAFLQSLAFVREQEGDLEEAESLYRLALPYPAPDLSGVVVQNFYSSKGPRLPFIGEPRSSLAAFYSNHGRIRDAEALYREQLAQASLTAQERLGAMRQLVDFLSRHGSRSDALALELQLLALVEAQPLPAAELRNQLAIERYTLANLKSDAGHDADAKEQLEADLHRALLLHGEDSVDYRYALNYLFENRRRAGDYEAAEVAAREKLRLAQNHASGKDEPGSLSDLAAALFGLADVRRAQGHTAEADSLQKRGIDANRASAPQLLQPRQSGFTEAEAFADAGNPEEALRIAEGIANAATARDNGEDFGFHRLAQSLVASGHPSEAARVASIALSLEERFHKDDPRVAGRLLDWVNFYRGMLRQPGRARELLSRAEEIIVNCCGTATPKMERVLQERAWLTAATDGEASSLVCLGQLGDLRASVYGAKSRQVEEAASDLAAAKARAAH